MAILQVPGYEILNEIGIGGMSRVYLANDLARQRQVAIKLLPSEYLNDLGYRARFEQEARLIAGLEHEAIVPVVEYGVIQSQPYFVMPYLAHGSLADRLRGGPLAPQLASQVLKRIGAALDYAHARGIVHRDLKASNILFDEGEAASLADFGIALHPASAWQRHLASGTPAYMSPEQVLRKGTVGPSSDVYSLGIIAFEMLTGRLPFDGGAPASILDKQIHAAPPALGSINPDLPATLEAPVQRALAKDPSQRYSSGGELANAFQDALLRNSSASMAESRPSNTLSPGPPGPSTEPASPQSVSVSPLPVVEQIQPEFSRFATPFIFLPGGKSRQRAKRRAGYQFYLLGLVIWLTVAMAAFTAVLARADVLFPSSNVLLIYSGPAVAVVNPSYAPVDLSGVVFQRISDQGAVTASFSAEFWDRVNPGSLRSLAAGDCFQLVRSQSPRLELIPGNAPAKPVSCEVSQGWLVAPGREALFWTLEGEGASFEVLRDNHFIYECRIADGSCAFYLPPRE